MAIRGTDSDIDLEALRRGGRVFRQNASASVLDLGDRVGFIEIRRRGNSLSDEIYDIVRAACEDGAARFDAIVLGNCGQDLSAGEGLAEILAAARAGEWEALDRWVRRRQNTSLTLKYGRLPVVAANIDDALGWGCEVCLHSARVVIAGKARMGLSEASIGLVPAGGGTKELGLRILNRAAARREALLPALRPAFDLIFHARVSQVGREAQARFLTTADIVVPGGRSLIDIAKHVATALAECGFRVEGPRTDIPAVGRAGIHLFHNLIGQMLERDRITEHDALVAREVAAILCGGNRDAGTASEQHFLDLERESFLSLLGTPKTQQRIVHLLRENELLRN